ncbi:MAG: MotA/TolQ/ExbB proton channel family protein [Candidatus Hydrogenedentota bacterium]
MDIVTTVLYWISTGMLVPVIVTLLAGFVWALLMLGDLYALYAARLRRHKEISALLTRAKSEPVSRMDLEAALQQSSRFRQHLLAMRDTAWHPIHSEKILSDFDMACEKELEGPSTLMRVGPMLGLMGTLIPMGPALMGLAAGDLASMAANMQVAFATTVIGIFTGAIGYLTQLIKRRWFSSDGAALQYLSELARGPQETRSEPLSQGHDDPATHDKEGNGNEKAEPIHTQILYR